MKMMLQKTDSGLYECQISSAPVMSHVLHLAVTEPVTEPVPAPPKRSLEVKSYKVLIPVYDALLHSI